jgi:hypothetical protein
LGRVQPGECRKPPIYGGFRFTALTAQETSARTSALTSSGEPKMRDSLFTAAPGKSTCAAWMYRSVIEPCECPALSWTYACGLPAGASRARV